MTLGSKIFEKNRAIGYVCNHVPLVARYIKLRNENLAVTVVGRCFHTYGCNRFSILSVSGLHPSEINCLAADAYHIYTCCNTEIFAWRRGTELKHTYKGHKKPIHIILPLGPYLLSIDEDSIMKIWDIKSENVILEYPFSNATFEVSAIMHPNSYLNKVLLGSKQGTLQLLNIHTSKLVYTFQGWGSEITVLEQAPAIDVVAVGLADGKIVVHNIRYDSTLMEFMQDWGSVTRISFRTDGPPIMVSGTLTGHLVIWNLEEKKLVTQIVSAHNGAITGMKFLPNEPLLLTSSPDNSLKLWIFDTPDGGARLLRLREGHSNPPTFIRYHDNNGHNILSAGSDSSMRIFSTVCETFNKNLGVALYNPSRKNKQLKHDDARMPPIIQFASETTREKEWDDTAAIHLGLGTVTTWSYGKLKMGELKLIPEKLKPKTFLLKNQVIATCLCLTSCGNFVVVGYNTGDLHKFNIQSGLHRGAYGVPTAHNGPVRGVCVDNLNQMVVSGGSDGYMKYWSFKTAGGQPLSENLLEEPVLFVRVHRESSLVAVALEDYAVVVVDLDTRLTIRRFAAHSSQLTDMAFSPDARWLVTASMDCTICTWDIPSSHLVDVFKVDVPCTSLTFSPTGDRLATVHVNCLGIYLWSNRSIFEHVSLCPMKRPVDIPTTSLPTTVPGEPVTDATPVEDEIKTTVSCEQISEDLATLSLVSQSRWQNLLNIDVIWKKNKPKHLLKKPQVAPFFLPTVPSLDFQFDLNKESAKSNDGNALLMGLKDSTVFRTLLHEAVNANDFVKAMQKLKESSLSAINYEISALSSEGTDPHKVFIQFIKMIDTMLLKKRDFEVTQAYMALFFKKHGNTVASQSETHKKLQSLQTLQEASWHILQNKLMSCLCIVESLKCF